MGDSSGFHLLDVKVQPKTTNKLPFDYFTHVRDGQHFYFKILAVQPSGSLIGAEEQQARNFRQEMNGDQTAV